MRQTEKKTKLVSHQTHDTALHTNDINMIHSVASCDIKRWYLSANTVSWM